MPKEILLEISPLEASDKKLYSPLAAKKLKVSESEIKYLRIIRKSIDARQKNIKVNLLLEAFLKKEVIKEDKISFKYRNVSNSPEVVIVGAGPSGLFAALRLIECGIKPVIIERGKNVEERRIDINELEQSHVLNNDSNYCFGEGGAGTFSDGKLYTRSKKRGDHNKVLEVLHFHGADESILYETHPHIGSDKLPSVISNIRRTILDAGGRIYFNSKLTDIVIKGNNISSILLSDGSKVVSQAVILATGHSSRDVYYLLNNKKILLENKNFAMGIRIEHPQELINEIQYRRKKIEYLPAASYNVVQQVNGRGVYSFCMCPGGQIVPASTGLGEIVVNGMSESSRGSYFANSGLVVQIFPADYSSFGNDGLSAMKLQETFEKSAFENSNKDLTAPAQRVVDFLNSKTSSSLPKTSYIPGVISSPLHNWMPEFISSTLKTGLKEIGKKMKGFISQEALMVGVESRTSSPVRIPRDSQTGSHIQIEDLFPCGEGAGYSGGIVSSAVDGERLAEKVAEYLKKKKLY